MASGLRLLRIHLCRELPQNPEVTNLRGYFRFGSLESRHRVIFEICRVANAFKPASFGEGLYSFGQLRMYVCTCQCRLSKDTRQIKTSYTSKIREKSLITTRWQQIVAVAPILFVLENT